MRAAPLRVLLLVHYPPSASASMRGFAGMIATGLRSRGHHVECCTAPVLLGRLARANSRAAKWLGYLDQFLLFPPLLWWRQRTLCPGTLLVLADQALGPWLPLLRRRPHVVHAHDLLALESSLGRWPANPLAASGRLYQRLIRWGFRRGRSFLCVSAASADALRPHLHAGCQLAVLANPLDPAFQPGPTTDLSEPPFLLHVGSNWYKNRPALLQLFAALIRQHAWPDLRLVLVGPPDAALQPWLLDPALRQRLVLHPNLPQAQLISLYQRAAALVFPSLAEGFGWPPLEALACGCPAVISPIEPLLSLTSKAATVLPPFDLPQWPTAAAAVVDGVLRRSPSERQIWRARGLAQARRFAPAAWLTALEAHYSSVLTCGLLDPQPPSFPLPATPEPLR